MEKTLDELEDILPESSTQLVSLNTRIPRYVSDSINMCVGILQTESHYHKVSKQEAVQIILEKGIQAIRVKFESLDEFTDEQVESIDENPEQNFTIVENIERTEHTTISQKAYDMKAYAEFANKDIYRPSKPQAKREPTDKERWIQSKLGLR